MPNSSNIADQESKALKPIYEALDQHQYSKAYKFSYAKACCGLPIAKALRAHALERNKRKLEALLIIRSLLNSLSWSIYYKKDGLSHQKYLYWLELEELIWSLKVSGVEIIDEDLFKNNGVDTSAVSGMTQESDSSSTRYNSSTKVNITSSGKGKKKKSGKKSSTSSPNNISKVSNLSSTQASDKKMLPLDLIDVLDTPKWERKQIILNFLISSECIPEQELDRNLFKLILDETTLATIALTIRSLRLNETLVQLYTITTESIISGMTTTKTPIAGIELELEKERLCSAFTELYLSCLRVVTDFSDYQVSPQKSKSLTISTEFSPESSFHLQGKKFASKQVMEAYENAQLASMQLSKYSGSKLHLSWCAYASLMYRKSCLDYIEYLRIESDTLENSQNDNEEEKKLQMKISMLPRLAESLMFRVVGDHVNVKKQVDSESGSNIPPNAEDWDLYLQTLEVQGKHQEALDVLKGIQVANQSYDDGREPIPLTKIHDEIDVCKHQGSLIQIAERERFSKMARLCVKMKEPKAASYIYSNKLLRMMPDQWEYWLGLLETTIDSCGLENEALEKCNQILRDIETLVLSSSTSRIPLRSPLLFKVEIAGYQVRKGDCTGNISLLSQAILDYANIFATLVSCTFQDLRPYIDLLVKQSCDDGNVSEEVIRMLEWAKQLRDANDPSTKIEAASESDSEKRTRREKLRAYILSVQMCFEIWHLLLSFHSDRELFFDEMISSYVPGAEEMINLWENTSNLGSNPKDGGQKEFLPGDDLILLSTQLIYHQTRFLHEEKRKMIHIVVAAILERALNQSPYNSYIKIAACRCHCENKSINRAWEIFQDLEIKYIQFDSCSYLIFPHFIENAMFQETMEISKKIISMHDISAKDIANFMTKSFENGRISKGHEIIDWHRKSMRKSLQLLEAKLQFMDQAPLHRSNDTSVALGEHHGLCGTDKDVERVQKLVRDSGDFFSASSLIGSLSHFEPNVCDICSFEVSDNRDFTVNQFEILIRNEHSTSLSQSTIMMHSLMTRIVLLIQVANPPKKGKLVSYKKGDSMEKRWNSLVRIIHAFEGFIQRKESNTTKMNTSLWNALMKLTRTISTLIVGKTHEDSKYVSSLSERESACVDLLQHVLIDVSKAHNYLEESDRRETTDICRMLLVELLPFYTILENTGNLFAVFGWGKRKRTTKAAAGTLANIAMKLKDIIDRTKDMLLFSVSSNAERLCQNKQSQLLSSCVEILENVSVTAAYMKNPHIQELLKKVTECIASSNHSKRENVEAVLNHMAQCLEAYFD